MLAHTNKSESEAFHQDTDTISIPPNQNLLPAPLLTLRLKSLSTLDPPHKLNILIYAPLGPNAAAKGHRGDLKKHLELRRQAAVYAGRWG